VDISWTFTVVLAFFHTVVLALKDLMMVR